MGILLRIFLILVFVLFSGCPSEPPPPAEKKASTNVAIEPLVYKTPVLMETRKNYSAADKEFVTIAGRNYQVMPPWLGNRVIKDEAKKLDFAAVPSFFTFEEGKIYATKRARDAFVRMAEAALEDGVILEVDSGYRSVSFQRQIYMKQLDEGKSFADIARWTAPPGYSEHALGTAFDLTPSNWTFYDTSADKWLRENAEDYAFTLSYPRKTEKGFAWEPWHWRYVGEEEYAENDS